MFADIMDTIFSQIAATTRQSIIFPFSTSNYSLMQYLHHVKNTSADCYFIIIVEFSPPWIPPNVTYRCQSGLKYAKNDLKYCDLKLDFRLGGLSVDITWKLKSADGGVTRWVECAWLSWMHKLHPGDNLTGTCKFVLPGAWRTLKL